MTELPPELPHNPNRVEPRALRPHLSRKQITLMVLVALVGGAALLTLKSTANHENAQIRSANQNAAEQRMAEAETISKTLLKRYGGLSSNTAHKALVGRVGDAIRGKLDPKSTAPAMRFHLLTEENSINMFALANGDVYVTTALINRMQTEGQLAAVLAHGVAHVVAQHDLAALPVEGEALPMWSYATRSEREADALGLKLMSSAGYDPNAMIGMLSVLVKAYNDGADVAFFTTHPNEEGRLNEIEAAIHRLYPQGIPAVLSK
jgi:beta-barrel assembly-enhancing protease